MTCSCCPNEVERPGYCLECKSEYNKLFAKPVAYYGPEQVKRAKVRGIANAALKKGIIKREPCEVPGCTEKAQMHHPDYSQPLKVEWQCRQHHLMWHRIESGKFLRRQK